jgi:hypothetical protein
VTLHSLFFDRPDSTFFLLPDCFHSILVAVRPRTRAHELHNEAQQEAAD